MQLKNAKVDENSALLVLLPADINHTLAKIFVTV